MELTAKEIEDIAKYANNIVVLDVMSLLADIQARALIWKARLV